MHLSNDLLTFNGVCRYYFSIYLVAKNVAFTFLVLDQVFPKYSDSQSYLYPIYSAYQNNLQIHSYFLNFIAV